MQETSRNNRVKFCHGVYVYSFVFFFFFQKSLKCQWSCFMFSLLLQNLTSLYNFGHYCWLQAIVGDKTIAFFLMDKEMYSGMSCLNEASPTVERGVALHKVCSSTFGTGSINCICCFSCSFCLYIQWLHQQGSQ